jgi:hypothetical protein
MGEFEVNKYLQGKGRKGEGKSVANVGNVEKDALLVTQLSWNVKSFVHYQIFVKFRKTLTE